MSFFCLAEFRIFSYCLTRSFVRQKRLRGWWQITSLSAIFVLFVSLTLGLFIYKVEMVEICGLSKIAAKPLALQCLLSYQPCAFGWRHSFNHHEANWLLQ